MSRTDIELEAVPRCYACNGDGALLYADVRDHTFGTPGLWRLSRCRSCDLIWLDPRPTSRDIGKIYDTYYTHGVRPDGAALRTHVAASLAAHPWLQAAKKALRGAVDEALARRYGYVELRRPRAASWAVKAASWLPSVGRAARMEVLGLGAGSRGRLLDVGCGNGSFLSKMAGLGWQCVGNETDPKAAAFARSTFGLVVHEGGLADAGLADATFDVVTLSHVIEHVHAPHDLLRECRRLLKPGGRLIVLTPNTRSLGHRIFGRAWRGLEPPRHLHCFHPLALQACVERAGMRTDRLTTESRMTRAIWYASRLTQRADQGGRRVNSAFDYVSAYVMQFVEGIACRIDRNAGEEIMLVASKPAPAQGATAADTEH